MFNRTICLTREPLKNGKTAIRRIQWDLVEVDGYDEFFVSQIPVNVNGFELKVATAAYFPMLTDMLAEDLSNRNIIDEVVKIEFFNSEEEFYNLYGNAFGSYKTDDPGSEFGFPYLFGSA